MIFTFQEKIKSDQAGFTFMEMLISVSMFVLLVFAVSVVYVSFNKDHLFVRASQELLNETQYTLEMMSREIRRDTIVNYDPSPAWCDSILNTASITFANGSFDNCILLKRIDGQTIAFSDYYANNNGYTYLFYIVLDCAADYSSCDVNWQRTASSYVVLLRPSRNSINVRDLKFAVNPAVDPSLVGGTSNNQPQVTVMLATEYVSDRRAEQIKHVLQTTVSSRLYQR